MLSFITTYALYFVSLRQTNLFNANLNNAINDEIRRDIEKLKSELWTQHYNAPKGNMSAYYSTGISSSQPTYFCKNVLRTFFNYLVGEIGNGLLVQIAQLILDKKEIKYFQVN